jgi:hypothetical protein
MADVFEDEHLAFFVIESKLSPCDFYQRRLFQVCVAGLSRESLQSKELRLLLLVVHKYLM